MGSSGLRGGFVTSGPGNADDDDDDDREDT